MLHNEATKNPMALLDLENEKAKSRQFIGSADIDYKIHGFEDLRLHATLGADITKNDLKKLGFTEQSEVTAEQMLKEAQEKWSVYHINVKDHAGNRFATRNPWHELLGDHLVETQSSDGSDVDRIISGIVISEYTGETGKTESHEPDAPVQTPSDTPLPEVEVNPYL